MAYIDKDRLLTKAHELFIQPNIELWQVCNLIANAPTVDVVEVKHGEWIPHKTMVRSPFARNYDCSVCGNSPIECGEYCNKCGAKMDGGKTE